MAERHQWGGYSYVYIGAELATSGGEETSTIVDAVSEIPLRKGTNAFTPSLACHRAFRDYMDYLLVPSLDDKFGAVKTHEALREIKQTVSPYV